MLWSHHVRVYARICFVLLLAGLLLNPAAPPIATAQVLPLTDYVNPLIGADGWPHTFPGPSLPFGLVKLGPDMTGTKTVTYPQEISPGVSVTKTITPSTNSGYNSTGTITGFSHTHVNGTGGAPKYGNISLMPTTGSELITGYDSPRANEVVKVGSYSVDLTRYGIKAELTASSHAGFHRYTFPKTTQAHILIDIEHHLIGDRPWYQRYLSGTIESVTSNTVTGYGTYDGGWNGGGNYTVYFCARMDQPATAHTIWQGTTRDSVATSKSDPQWGKGLGVILTYNTTTTQVVQSKVGISFISSSKACQSVDREIPGWDFDGTRQAAVDTWNAALGKIQIEGSNTSTAEADKFKKRRIIFYTSLYRSMLMPTDRTGENPNPQWAQQIPNEPYYDDYYTLWDTFRTLHPLLTLIQPSRQIDMVRSLIGIYRTEGYMPDGRSGNANGLTQGGSNAEMLIADAYVKGLTNPNLDYKLAFQAMLKDATVAPPDERDKPNDPGNDRKVGRGGLSGYNSKGYITTGFPRSGTRVVEYANNDWAIAQVARGLALEAERNGNGSEQDNYNAEYIKYREQASNWLNLWDSTLSYSGTTGFIRARNNDTSGTWVKPFDVTKGGSWADVFYEGSSWEYSQYVPQDVKKLVQKSGGRANFVKKLDTLFDGKFYNIANEPSFFSHVLYIWAGQPDKTAERIWSLMDTKFTTDTVSGVPGNDDSGAMASWYVFNAMGFFPNAGQDVYLITSPLFSKSVIDLGNGKTFTIEATGASLSNKYIQSATLNGQPIDRAWFRHNEIANGGKLVLTMGNSRSSWATAAAQEPPSLSDRELFYSGFEPDETPPTWSNAVESSINMGGYTTGLTATESVTRAVDERHAGNRVLMYSGRDNDASVSYSYNKVFDVHGLNLKVSDETALTYWIYPQSQFYGNNGINSTYVAIDLAFDDGTFLRGLKAVDANGVYIHPNSQGNGGKLVLDTWNQVRSQIGKVAKGKTIERILVAYDHPSSTGTFRGYIDDIRISN